jgi:hypothetical protein
MVFMFAGVDGGLLAPCVDRLQGLIRMLYDFGSVGVAINDVLCPKHQIGEDRVATIDRLTHAPTLIEDWKVSCA